MALINCPECGRQVSDSAVACPQCGFGVAQYMERQREIQRIQNEAEQEAYAATKKIMAEKAAENERLRKEAEERQRKEAERIEQLYVDAVNKFNSDDPDQVLKAKEIFASILNYKDSASYINNWDTRYETVMQEDELKRGEKLLEKEKKLSALKKILVTCVLFGLGVFLITSIGSAKKNSNKAQTTGEAKKGVFSDNCLYNAGTIYKNVSSRLSEVIPEGYAIKEATNGEICILNEDKETQSLKENEGKQKAVLTNIEDYAFLCCKDNGSVVTNENTIPTGFIMIDRNNKEYNEHSLFYFISCLFPDITKEEIEGLLIDRKTINAGASTAYILIDGIVVIASYPTEEERSVGIDTQYMLLNETIEYTKCDPEVAIDLIFGFSSEEIDYYNNKYDKNQFRKLVTYLRNHETEITDFESLEKAVFSTKDNSIKETETTSTVETTQSTVENTVTPNAIEHYCEVDGCTNEGTYKITGLNGTDEYYCFKHYTEMDKTLKSMEQETQASTKSTHYCESSGCYNEGTHKIMGLNGYYEYYCDKHYKEINDILGRMEQDVGSGSQSKHQCEVGGCSKEGTHSMVGLNGTMEYYCTEHYNEMAEIMQRLTGGS